MTLKTFPSLIFGEHFGSLTIFDLKMKINEGAKREAKNISIKCTEIFKDDFGGPVTICQLFSNNGIMAK